MNHLNERQLKELLTMNNFAEAPADLAERIKAEIPENLDATTGGAATDAGNVIRFPRIPFRMLALAATLMAVVGASWLTYRLAKETDPVSSLVEHRPTEPVSRDDSDDRASAGESGPQEQQTMQSQTRSSEARSRKDDVAAPAAPSGQVQVEEVQLEDARTPAEGQFVGGEVEESTSTIASELSALGYLAEGRVQEYEAAPEAEQEVSINVRSGVPRIESAAAPTSALPYPPPPPPPPASPAPRAKRIPPPTQLLQRRLAEPPRPPSVAPSTGGTAEPNDAPYGDVFFDSAGVNPFVDTEDDALSTFGLDVDTGSYTIARRILRDGYLPPPESVRVEEYLNFFDYGDEAPAKGDFAIHAEGAPSIFGQNDRYYLLRFNVHGREIDVADRQPAHLIFVVDVSGSMDQENRLGLVKKALALLLAQLRDDDRISLVVYGSQGRVLLQPTSDRDAIRRAIDALRPEGATNAEEGLRLAYDLAARHFRRGAINRVILCSDGVANVGNTSADSILARIRSDAERGIELTTVGFGMGNYNDTLMERLADTGNGRYAYVDSLDEARRIFVEDLTGTLQTIAAEARVQVEFNPEVVSRYRLLGYENRDVADERFRDDTVDAGEIGAGHSVTALYEIKLEGKPRRREEIATLHLRWASAAAAEMVETSHTVTGKDFTSTWDRASPALRLTSLVAEFAELLKKTYWSKGGELDGVFFRAQQVSAEFAGDRDVAEFVSLVGRAAEYRRLERGSRD